VATFSVDEGAAGSVITASVKPLPAFEMHFSPSAEHGKHTFYLAT
jgi:hypothetical protein